MIPAPLGFVMVVPSCLLRRLPLQGIDKGAGIPDGEVRYVHPKDLDALRIQVLGAPADIPPEIDDIVELFVRDPGRIAAIASL
jgi:hypothetical protein